MSLKLQKEECQANLIFGMASAFEREMSDSDREIMSQQMARVEKLFGFVPYAHVRGV